VGLGICHWPWLTSSLLLKETFMEHPACGHTGTGWAEGHPKSMLMLVRARSRNEPVVRPIKPRFCYGVSLLPRVWQPLTLAKGHIRGVFLSLDGTRQYEVQACEQIINSPLAKGFI
jgi:hypothetical protein